MTKTTLDGLVNDYMYTYFADQKTQRYVYLESLKQGKQRHGIPQDIKVIIKLFEAQNLKIIYQ